MRQFSAFRMAVVSTVMVCGALPLGGGCGGDSGSVPPEGSIVEGKSEEQRNQDQKNMMDYYNSQKGKTSK